MTDIIWAMGGRRTRNIAHAYLNEDDYGKGFCLCSRTVLPGLRFPGWDIDDEDMRAHTCPNCLERLQFLKALRKKDDDRQ